MNTQHLSRLLTVLCIGSLLTTASYSQTPAEDALQAPLTGNIGLVSSYRFRGLAQTSGQPALQGGIDYAAANGLYLGNWNSNVKSGAGYPEGHLEMDFYGGYKFRLGNLGVDAGALYYYYPGTRLEAAFAGLNQNHPGPSSQSHVDNAEIYTALSWDNLILKYSYAVTNYFTQPGTRGSSYLELASTHDLGDGYQLGLHAGHLFMHGLSYLNADGSHYDGSYTDWKIGITKDLSGWTLGAAYIGTNARGNCSSGDLYCFSARMNSQGTGDGSHSHNAGKGVMLLSLIRNF